MSIASFLFEVIDNLVKDVAAVGTVGAVEGGVVEMGLESGEFLFEEVEFVYFVVDEADVIGGKVFQVLAGVMALAFGAANEEAFDFREGKVEVAGVLDDFQFFDG